MPREFRMPEIAESIVEGEIGKWYVQAGSMVKKDMPLLEILTDKVNVEVPSPFDGVVEKILVSEGQIVKVGTPILLYSGVGEEEETITEEIIKKREAAEIVAEHIEKKEKPGMPMAEHEKAQVKATPAVRALAKQLGVDLNKVVGTGSAGRITKEDVEKAAEKMKVPPPEEKEERIPFRGRRRMVAQHLRTSADHAVHTLYVEEADVSHLVSIRQRLKSIAESEGIRLTYLPFIAKALVKTLKQYPLMNASLDEENGEIVVKHYYHIGIAVDTPDGLMVPVVKDVEKKTIFEIAREIEQLVEKARNGTLTLDDVTRGTFSISSAGHIGGFLSMPIINFPECAILGVHRIRKRPVVVDNQIVIRDVVYFSITFDHRIVDGATVAHFMNDFISHLQSQELFPISESTE